jgi:hypothetical protein
VHVLVVWRNKREDPNATGVDTAEVYVHENAILQRFSGLDGRKRPDVGVEAESCEITDGNERRADPGRGRSPLDLAALISSRARSEDSDFSVLTPANLTELLGEAAVVDAEEAFRKVSGQIEDVSRRCVDGILNGVGSEHDAAVVRELRDFDSRSRCKFMDPQPSPIMYQLLGCDFLISSSPNDAPAVVFLECNTNPAIASGTMARAPKLVYERMTRHMIERLVPDLTSSETSSGSSTIANGNNGFREVCASSDAVPC